VKVASELLKLTGATEPRGFAVDANVEGDDDEVYDVAGWSDDKKLALSAIVRLLTLPCTNWPRVHLLTHAHAHDTTHDDRCGQVWADGDEADGLRHSLLASFADTWWPTRHGLARALDVTDLPPPTEEELRREAEQKLQHRQSKTTYKYPF
jgi:hypothetical protein